MLKPKFRVGQVLHAYDVPVIIKILDISKSITTHDLAYQYYILDHFIPREIGQTYRSNIDWVENLFCLSIANYNKLWSSLNDC